MDQLSEVFLKPIMKKMNFVFKGSNSALDKVADTSIMLIFVRSVNESQEGMNRTALWGQSTGLPYGVPT